MADNEARNDLPLLKRPIGTLVELPIFINMVAVSLTVNNIKYGSYTNTASINKKNCNIYQGYPTVYCCDHLRKKKHISTLIFNGVKYFSGSAISNIILYKTCVNSLDYTTDECKFFLSPVKINQTSDLEVAVQRYSTYITTIKTVLEYICPIILSIFLGGWSDTHGRKPLIVWPLFGMSITGILMVIFGMTESLGPWWFIGTSLPFSLTGGYVVLFTGAYCYVSDTSSLRNTAIRMMLLDAATSLGTFTGSLLSSYLIAMMGNVYLLLFTATLNVVAYAFTNVVMVESLIGALQNGASQIFDFSYAKEMLKECFKERPNRGRPQIIIIAIVRLLILTITLGIMNLEYLYSRQKLHWYLRDYTTYSAVCTGIGFFGGAVGIIVLQRLLRWGDIAISIIAILSTAADNLIKLFAVHSWQMYLGSSISLFKGLTGPLMRSYVTKFLPTEDKAKVFALLCVAESLALIIGPVIFNSLYSVTLAVFPGAIYVLASVLNIACVCLLMVVQYYSCSRRSDYIRINDDTS